MSSVPASAGEAVLVAVQPAAPGLFRPFDAEQSTRFEAALEALSPNTRRAYGSALAAWGRWAALQGVHALSAPPFALRVYLRERAARRHLLAATDGGRAAQGAGACRCRADRE